MGIPKRAKRKALAGCRQRLLDLRFEDRFCFPWPVKSGLARGIYSAFHRAVYFTGQLSQFLLCIGLLSAFYISALYWAAFDLSYISAFLLSAFHLAAFDLDDCGSLITDYRF